jgi:hypothetical protein
MTSRLNRGHTLAGRRTKAVVAHPPWPPFQPAKGLLRQ